MESFRAYVDGADAFASNVFCVSVSWVAVKRSNVQVYSLLKRRSTGRLRTIGKYTLAKVLQMHLFLNFYLDIIIQP